MNVWPPKVNAAVRAAELFAATLKVTLPVPVPVAGAGAAQRALLLAVQGQPVPVETDKVTAPPEVGNDNAPTAETAYVHDVLLLLLVILRHRTYELLQK